VRQQDPAGRRAREVVGLYGDPDTTWGICLEVGLAAPLVLAEVSSRRDDLLAAYPHLGPAEEIQVAAPGAWNEARALVAAESFAEDGPQVRLLLDADGRRLLVTAHHGVCDGLGLVAIAQAVSGVPMSSLARGIGDRAAPRSFLASSAARLSEALLRPPPRFGAHRTERAAGETLVITTMPRSRVGTVDLCLAIGAVFADWNRDADGRLGHPLFVSGASRRPAGALAPDRQTAYLRFAFDLDWNRDQAASAFAALSPEPEFPETSAGGIGPRITRLLRNRLGATAQLSNLGVVEGPGLVHAAMFPALSGPRGMAVGLVSTSATTTLSLRTRGSEFAAADTAELLDRIAAALPGSSGDQ
jgi:hypothetical protein